MICEGMEKGSKLPKISQDDIVCLAHENLSIDSNGSKELEEYVKKVK